MKGNLLFYLSIAILALSFLKTTCAESRRKLFGLESKTIVYEWLNIKVPAQIYFGVTITRLLEKG
ncbi:hypothetical protein A5867_001779 [Enterococcus sp. 6D12_DIV0197]|nr:hypothetical protein A5867_001779 [Enterococcus sp. 6D12_DIV0197]